MSTHLVAPKCNKSSFQTVWKLETGWKLEINKNNELEVFLVSNWKLELETWKLAETPVFLRVTGQILVSSLSPTPKGVVGVHQRLRLERPTSAFGTINQQSPNRVATHPTKNVIATLTTTQPKEKRYG